MTALGNLNCAWGGSSRRGKNKPSTESVSYVELFQTFPSTCSLNSRTAFLRVERLEAFSSLSLCFCNREHNLQLSSPRKVASHSDHIHDFNCESLEAARGGRLLYPFLTDDSDLQPGQ